MGSGNVSHCRTSALLIIIKASCSGVDSFDPFEKTQAGDMDVAGEVREHEHGCSARRRRERRLRAWWRHEQFAIRCAVASATHHSAYRPRASTPRPRL